jgi:anti-anti-sigma factor
VTDASYRIAREAGTVRLFGEFDINARDELREALLEAVESAEGVIVVDFDETVFIDSEALGALVEGLTASRERGVPMTVVNAHGLVGRVLEVSGLLDLFGGR